MAVDYSVGGLGIDIKLNGVETALSQIDQLQKQLKTKVGGTTSSSGGGSSSKIAKSVGIFTQLGRFNYYLNMMRHYGKAIGSAVQKAIDFNETLNLWQVSMRSNIGLAEEFITKMSKAYGLSQETLMRYQATFKNMLSALGDLEEGVTTKLSELLLARAVDFASLYNISNERAFTMFQAVLSGQVRPIRSVSGYDITEKTIFDIYQQAGGNKTVRGLSQIEKRLLRIYAVFNQMERTGAVGDWAKQIEEPANQLRILGEQMKELGQWFGQFFLTVLTPVLPKVNAFVITLKEIVKTLNFANKYFTPDHLEDFEASFVDANEAVEELQGNLFSFDKFDVAGSGAMGTFFGIDPTVQSLLDGMDTSIRDINMEAMKLSDTWLTKLGFIWSEEDGRWVIGDKAQNIIDIFNALGKTMGVLIGLKFGSVLLGITKGVLVSANAFKLLNIVLVSGIIYSFIRAIDLFKQGDTWGGILATTIGVSLVGAFILLNKKAIATVIASLGRFIVILTTNAMLAVGSFAGGIAILAGGFLALGVAVAGAIYLFSNWDLLNNTEKWVGALGVIATAILGVALALGAFQSAWSLGLAAAGIVAGIGAISYAIISSQNRAKSIQQFASGGFPAQGQMFIARESGAELVGNIGGRTAVANNDQIVEGIAIGVGQEVAPLVAITRAIYNVIKSRDTQRQGIDYQVLANNLTPYIEKNLATKGVRL